MELDGHVVIITGAGRGIGRATALELARMGAHIVVAELNPANAERTRPKCEPSTVAPWSCSRTSRLARI
jgi:NAD(P)-dependent dehydrogenase (short-subunit alcohol dehydrogenase family)